MDEIFAFNLPIWELVVRGTAVYWFLFILFRFVLRRDVGQIGVADVLLVVLVADAAQNAMAGSYTTVPEGMLLIATIAAWNLALDFLAYRSEAIARFVEPPAVLLVRHGRPIYAAMKKQLLTEEELVSKLRSQGVESLAEVKHVYLEADGKVSVIRRKQ